MNDQPDPTDPKKFFDITPASQTVPSTTSRPVVVGNKPEQTDQMVQPSVPKPEPTPEPIPEPGTVIQVVSPGSVVEPGAPESTPEAAEPLVDSEPAASSGAVITTENFTPSITYDESTNAELKDAEQKSPTPNVSIADPAKPSPEPNPQQQVVVHKNPRNLSKSLFWGGLILIALIVVFDVLLDYGILKLSIGHTHFFDN